MEEFFYAFTELMEAHNDCSKARNEYDGYSWGYYGQHYEDAIND